jgi:hypothetical protein
VRRDNAQRADRHGLKLVRDDHDAAVSAAVSALDSRIDRVPPPVASPVQVGTVERFTDPYASRPRVAWVLRLLGGEEVIVLAPMRLDTTNFVSAVEVLMDTALAEAEPA